MTQTETAIAGPAPVLLTIDGVSRSFGAIRAVSNVSFEVRAGEVHGLCGHNGAGKSTVVKMLAGLLQPDEGRILIGGGEANFTSARDAQARGVALVDQELSVVPALSVLDNLFLGNVAEPLFRSRRESRSRARGLLDAVGLTDLDPEAYIEDLSMGQRQLVEIARALGRKASLFILDEPTATLSSVDIEHVFRAIRKVTAAGCAAIYVSHRLDEVMELCHRVTVMRDGQRVDTVPTSAISGSDLVAMMLGSVPETARPRAERSRQTDVALEVRNLSAGARTRGVNLAAERGRIYGFAGQVGSGTADVVRAIAGLSPDASGRVRLEGRPVPLGSPQAASAAGIAYVSGDRKGEGLFLGQSIQSNLTATRLRAFSIGGILRLDALKAVAVALCQAIGIKPERLPEAVSRLSGGNQQKVLLGRCLRRSDTKVLLLDEPTRGVDVRGRAEIHALIRGVADEGAVVVFASTELDEILHLADVVIAMRGGVIVSERQRAEVDAASVLADMTHSALEGAA
ncbi:MAG TPA: sugar ABC transporter ATP-binding protein [Hypericibacter adhaerens]|uniref:sugar ABC transporter ATP-binding protein n=1 Tax=Hypericibacter adhaerens TaxID=2602016 RepID=UPI002CDA6287|nr:sugar ABC transporter ATP-binding protein [Hypericibacter adhaerens]HWA45588.1 sugar ABC transporter ATP-binding protein [Hypericibacter adhaerens]